LRAENEAQKRGREERKMEEKLGRADDNNKDDSQCPVLTDYAS